MSTSASADIGDFASESASLPDGLSVCVYDTLADAAPAWRALETGGVLTPYQRYDWIAGYLRSGFKGTGRIAILLITDRGQPIALAPFGIVRRFGVRVAQIIGMPVSNGDALVFDPAFTSKLTRETLAAAFRSVPADLVNFHCVAPHVGGVENPLLAFPNAPAPDNFYVNALAPGKGSYIDQSLPHKRRTNIKRSQRRLVEGFGEVRLHTAQSAEEIDRLLAVFLDQRGKRFEQMGVENLFAAPAFKTFFRTLAVEGLTEIRPALRVHGLYAGDRVVATSIGAYGPSHYSQYINSTDYGEASRYSLMGVMLSHLVDELRLEGLTSFDMGLGDFDYKLDWTQKQTVHDIVVPNSFAGRLAGPALRRARGFKRTIKQTPRLWKMARAVQSLKNRLKAGSR